MPTSIGRTLTPTKELFRHGAEIPEIQVTEVEGQKLEKSFDFANVNDHP